MPETVSPPTRKKREPGVNVVGYVTAALSLLLLVPVLPFVAVAWVYDRLVGGSPESEP